jgi:hypothetical protein
MSEDSNKFQCYMLQALLQDFDDQMFLKAVNIDLMQEDKCLQMLDEKTDRM